MERERLEKDLSFSFFPVVVAFVVVVVVVVIIVVVVVINVVELCLL